MIGLCFFADSKWIAWVQESHYGFGFVILKTGKGQIISEIDKIFPILLLVIHSLYHFLIVHVIVLSRSQSQIRFWNSNDTLEIMSDVNAYSSCSIKISLRYFVIGNLGLPVIKIVILWPWNITV